MRALIVVDVQNDFCHGSLATTRGDSVAEAICRYISRGSTNRDSADSSTSAAESASPEFARAHGSTYDFIVATQDWHIDPGAHFAAEPDYVDSWPKHCLAGSEGAELHAALTGIAFDAFFRKGEYAAAYSGFEGTTPGPGPHDATPDPDPRSAENQREGLATWLRQRNVNNLDVCGIATDFCVRATVLDAIKEGFRVSAIRHLCAAVSEEGGAQALKDMAKAGAKLA